MRPLPLAPAAATVVLALSACAGGVQDGAPATTAADDDPSAELTAVTVGVLPIVDTAPIWLGVEEGIFAEHGLDVELAVAQGGAAVVPAVVAGEYQFGFSNVTSLLLAESRGLPLRLVAPGSFTTGDPDADIAAVVTQPASGITSPADLAGRTVAVNTLGNIGESTVRKVVEDAGGDPAAVRFVELGFPDMPAAVAGGQVDAAWVNEPFLTITKDQGARVVSHTFAAVDPEMLIAAYFTSAEYAASDPGTVEAFAAAMSEASARAAEDPDAAREILGTYTEIGDDVIARMVVPRYSGEVPEDSVRLLADLALRYGLVDDEIDVSALLR